MGQLRNRERDSCSEHSQISLCDHWTQNRIDKSLLTSREASPLGICKCGTAAIIEEGVSIARAGNLFKGRWIQCEVLMRNVLFLPGS